MKILFDQPLPYFLAHGGVQIQLEQTKTSLEKIGLETDYARWWDERQSGDIIHYIGRPASTYVQYAQEKGMKVVMADLLTGTGSRSGLERAAQTFAMRAAKALLPYSFTVRMAWDTFQRADACIALTGWEARLMVEMFKAPPKRVFVVPNGVEDVFFQSKPAERGPWLVCAARITGIKRVVELAEACVLAKAPLWVIGKPFSSSDEYAQRLVKLSKLNPTLIRYEGAISDRAIMANVYRQARGFVLLSSMESLSLSALEAAACGCPLLLTALPWAQTVFGEHARYVPLSASPQQAAGSIKSFYDEAPTMPPPARPATWIDVAHKLRDIYEGTLKR
jgi:glycosyltransferase involved in cell wall biosynthesis